MSSYEKINSQEDLDIFISHFYWQDAFVREIYAISPSYINDQDRSMFAPDALPNMKILICSQSSECPGVEMLFNEIEAISLPFGTEINPSGSFNNDFIEFSFTEIVLSHIRCKQIYYKTLDQACWGDKLFYGS